MPVYEANINNIHCEMEGLNSAFSKWKTHEKKSLNTHDLWGYSGSEDTWKTSSIHTSATLHVPDTTVNGEAFELDLTDDETLLSFLSVEENCENEPSSDCISESGVVEMSSVTLDNILSNTVNQIFGTEDTGKESVDTFGQSESTGNAMNVLCNKIGNYDCIDDNSTSAGPLHEMDYSNESFIPSHLGGNGSETQRSLLQTTTLDRITQNLPEEKQFHLTNAFQNIERCDAMKGKDVTQLKNIFSDLSNKKDVPANRGSALFQQNPAGIFSGHEEMQIGNCHWRSVQETETQKSARQPDQVSNFLQDCNDSWDKNKCQETLFGTSHIGHHLKEQREMSYLLVDEPFKSTCVFPDIPNIPNVLSMYPHMPSDAEILRPSEITCNYSLPIHSLDKNNYESDPELVSSLLSEFTRPSKRDVLQTLETENVATKVKETWKSQSVPVTGSTKRKTVSDVVWTMQTPKPSVSPLLLSCTCVQLPKSSATDDLVSACNRPKSGTIFNVTSLNERQLIQQDFQGTEHILEEKKNENASHMKCEGVVNETKHAFCDTKELHGITQETCIEGVAFSSEQPGTASFMNLTSDSFFGSSTLSTQFQLAIEDLSFQVPQEADNISGSKSDATETNVNLSEFFLEANNCSEFKVVTPAITHKYSGESSCSVFQNPSCNMNDFDTLLDSFMCNVESERSNPDSSVSITSVKENVNLKTILNNSMTPTKNNNTADEILDGFLSELDGEREVLIATSNNLSHDMEQLLSKDVTQERNRLSDSSASLKKKTLKPTIFQVHSASQKSRRNNAKGKKAKVKVQSICKPIRCVVRGQVVENISQKRIRTLRFVLDKERRLENQDGTGLWPVREDFNPDQFSLSQGTDVTSLAKQEIVGDRYVLENNLVPQAPFRPNEELLESSSFVLPIGETGLSVTIPTNTPTSITSFFPAASPGCIAKLAPILPSQYRKMVDIRNPMLTKPQVCTLLPYIPEKGNRLVHSQNGTQMIVPDSLAAIPIKKSVLQVSLSPVTSVEPHYVVVPTITHTKNAYKTPAFANMVSCPHLPNGVLNNSKAQNQTSNKQQPSWSSHMHPIAPKISQTNVSSSTPVKVSLEQNTNVLHPVKIFVSTKSKPVLPTIPKKSCMNICPNKPYMDEPRLKSKIVQSLQQNILKRKAHPDLVHKKFSRVLKDELRIRFPDIPEPILGRLNIPPQAIHRGYFSVLDLQTLRAQALALRLRMIFREHVSKCVARNCIMCLDFLKERQKLSWVEREHHLGQRLLKKDRNIRSCGRGRARGKRGSRVRGSRLGERDDPTYEPPYSYVSSKRKRNEVNYSVLDGKGGNPRRMCVHDCNNVHAVIKRFCRGKFLYDYCKLRKSYSETNIHALTKSLDVIDVKSQTCDDMYLPYCNRAYLKYFQNVQDMEVHPIVQEATKTRLHIMSTKDMYVYDQKDRKNQQMEMMKECLYDFSVKQYVEKEFGIPFSDADTKHSKGASQKPLYYDLHSLSIGPLKVSAKYDRQILPKLRVIFTAKKFTYEYELMCGMTKNHEPDPCKVRSVSGRPYPQLLLTVDIPFKTVQALAVQSNKVMLLVKTVPYIQIVARRGLSRVVMPERNALSQAQRKYFGRVKAVMSIFPLHKLMLADQGRATSLCDGLCGFASWFKTYLLNQLPMPEGHIPSWCLTPHLDPDMLARKLSLHTTQGYVEVSKHSTFIVRDSVSGKYFGKIVDKSNQPAVMQSPPEGNQPDSSRNNLKDIEDTMSTIYENCGNKTNKQKAIVALEKETGIPDVVENSAALYLLSVVRSILSSQRIPESPPYITNLQFPPLLYLEKGCTCRENCQ
ncbi:uncharacterized protein LOC125027619 isoform X2 [Penaeus chinensis]|uniref:uncharacterized protein LOC125027619 isoform X2 n=1 Tax=Penaeus chinensis TaxID=139456 RepID=UPI001FB5B318|nr:uncharacterized protein LOC125027619 isoform X2 [Penaeus chinensis]